MSKATEDALDLLHQLTAEALTEIIQRGLPVLNKEGEPVVDVDGAPMYVPAPASYYAAAIKLLKDNDITADLSASKPLQGLNTALPQFDDMDELPTTRQ